MHPFFKYWSLVLTVACISIASSWAKDEKLSLLHGLELSTGKSLSVNLNEAQIGTVLVFLSIKCPCSADHHQSLNELANTFSKKGFKFIGIHSNADEELKSSEEFFKNAKLSFPVIHDPESKIADLFGAKKTPHVFVVSPKEGSFEKRILFQGGVDNSKQVKRATQFYLKEALAALESGKSLSETNVRTLGCEIKRP